MDNKMMSECDLAGTNGICGDECPVLQRGDCEYIEEDNEIER